MVSTCYTKQKLKLIHTRAYLEKQDYLVKLAFNIDALYLITNSFTPESGDTRPIYV